MSNYEFNDSHIHLTNYCQEGPDIREFLKMMGGTIKRSVLFGLPLQQHWSYAEMGDVPPTYYMQATFPGTKSRSTQPSRKRAPSEWPA